MNERIQALAVKAGAEPSGGYVEQSNGDSVYSENAYVDPRDIDLEKFAQLIVRECMEQVWYSREDGINGNISEVIKDRIKQHFGVEE